MKTRLMLTGLALAMALVMLQGQPAGAIPAFARKYKTSCATCHATFPKLNAFGRAFRANGYRWPPADEDYIKEQQIPMGSEGQKAAFPGAIWPGDIPGSSVASFIVESNLNVKPDEPVQGEFDGIDEVALVIGGTLGESWSFFGDLDIFDEGKPGDIGRLFLQYNPRTYFHIRIGQFEPRAVPFSNHRRLLRLTGYLANTFPVVPADNFFGFSPNQRGVEAFGGVEGPGHHGGFEWAAGVLNGEPGGAFQTEGVVADQVAALDAAREDSGGEFDTNNGKDVYMRLSYKIGGLGVFGGGETTQAKNWRDDSIKFGGFFYRGTSGLFVNKGGQQVFNGGGNTFWRYGFDVDAFIKDVNILGGFERMHDNPDGRGRNFNVNLFTGEAQWVVFPWLTPATRIEVVDTDYAVGTFSRFSTDLSVMALANVKLLVEYTQTYGGAPDLEPLDKEFRLGLNLGF